MNRWTLFLLSLGLCSCYSGDALLPPLYQSIRELSAILASEELPQHLSAGEAIEAIHHNEEGYRIDGSRSSCFVKVIPIPQAKIGPMEFTLHFEAIAPTHTDKK